MASEASTPDPSIIIDDDISAEIIIPANLKFMLDALKLLSQNPLTTDNHLVWSSQVTTIFQANGFSKYLNPQTPIPNKTITNTTGQIAQNPLFPPWNLINSNLIAALIATISPSLQPLVLRKATVAEVWTSLMSRLQSQSRSRIIQLKEELHSLTMKSETMSQYLNNIKMIHDQLEAADSHIDDEDLIIYIMNGLPGLYNSFKTAFRLKTERVDLNTFFSLLLTEELNISRQHRSELHQSGMALSASRGRGSSSRTSNSRGRGRPPQAANNNNNYSPSSSGNGGGRGRNIQSRPNTPKAPGIECQICHKIGHTANHCWFRNQETTATSNRTALSSEIQPSYDTNSTTGSPTYAPDDWLLDSGATAHLTNQFQNLQLPAPYHGSDSITIGNGTQLPITHTGHHHLHTQNRKLSLPNLLYVPNLHHNLLSVYHLTASNNCRIIFDANHFTIQDKATNRVIHQGRSINGLYPLSPGPIALSATSSPTNAWHSRLGHPHPDIINFLSKSINCISFCNSSFSACNACDSSKSHKLSFKLSNIKSTKPFELIHSDLWGPSPIQSNQSFRYFIIFIDDFTRFTWLYPLTQKSDALLNFIKFHKMIKTQFNQQIKTLRSDNGGEYTSHNFKHYLTSHGITHQLSCPHTPEQNGVSERKIRHLMETTRTLLHHASLPLHFWLEAASTATYLINRLPTKTLHMLSPYQKLHHKPPSYSHLKTFGCLCYPWAAHSRPHKLAPKSLPCIFLGYSTSHKGFRCLDPNTQKLIISRHVKFHEDIFPMAAFTTTPPKSAPPPPKTPFLPLPTSPTTNPHTQKQIITPEPTLHKPIIYYQRRQPLTHHPQPENSPPPSTHNTSPQSLPEHSPLEPSSNTHHQPQPEHSNPPSHISQSLSTHPMITRSKSNNPIFNLNHSTEPLTYKTTHNIPQWQQAMQTEFNALINQQTWTLVPKPPNQTILGSKWTYKIKLHPDGTIDRHKARLVAQGFRQTPGIDFTDTFSPVAKIPTIRLFFIIATNRQWPITQLDVSNAFLHGTLNEKVYMLQPPGFKDPSLPNHVCLLKKSIYGLKQSSRQWNLALTSFLTTLGFHSSSADPSLYILLHASIQIYILIYVDDLLITGTDSTTISSIISTLSTKFKIRSLGPPKVFLGIHTTTTPNGLLLHQQPYIESILNSAGLESCKSVATPLPSNDTSFTTSTKPFSNPKLYRRIAGSLQYLVITRPDITHAVNLACQFMHKPEDHHFTLLTRILRYLKGTKTLGLPITKGPLTLTAYSDSDWAGNPLDRTSTTGYCIFLGQNIVHWKSQKQRTVARSSSEAEYRALSTTITELIWLHRLIKEFQIDRKEPTIIFCDNMSAISIAKNPILKARTKHVEIDHHFIREHINNGIIQIQHIPTQHQIADLLTKRLPKRQFNLLRSKLTLQPLDPKLEGAY